MDIVYICIHVVYRYKNDEEWTERYLIVLMYDIYIESKIGVNNDYF